MTILERKPKMAKKVYAAGHGHPPLGVSPVAEAQSRHDGFRIDPASARRMSKVIASAQARSAKVIGVTGARSGIGVSVISRELAGALASFGVKTLLVDLSPVTLAMAQGQAGEASLLTLAVEKAPLLSFVEVPAGSGPLALSADAIRATLAQAVQDGFTVVLDLPPVMQASGQPAPAIVAVGPLCDVVFLVSLSGHVSRAELAACVEAGQIVGLKMGGMVLNDWRMPANRLIGS